MQETINYLSIIDNKIRKSHTVSSKAGRNLHSLKEKHYFKRHNRFPYGKSIEFSGEEYKQYPKWLVEKEGFMDFMYKKYQGKLMSIPSICDKSQRASDEKYFISLFLNQISMFKNLPSVVSQTILSRIKTKYYNPGDLIHSESQNPKFIGVVFIGSVQYNVGKIQTIKEKNGVFMSDAFHSQKHPSIYCRNEAIVLALQVQVYQQIKEKLKQEIDMKERDQISDFMKSPFFSELHLKDKKAAKIYNNFDLQFYFKEEVICSAGQDVKTFNIVFKGDILEENHIYVREYNKWPMPNSKWQVRAVYNSYHKNHKMPRFSFFGDEQIVSNSKYKAKYISSSWSIIYIMKSDDFINNLNPEDVKRLKKYRSENLDFNYTDFEKNIRDKYRSYSENKKIIHKAINTSFHNMKTFTPRKMSLLDKVEKSMVQKSFFQGKKEMDNLI